MKPATPTNQKRAYELPVVPDTSEKLREMLMTGHNDVLAGHTYTTEELMRDAKEELRNATL